jgi:Delta7-sterol 5-desaturase
MDQTPLVVFVAVAGAQLLRYLVLAGGLFALSQRWSPPFIKRRRIARQPTSTQQAWREVSASFGSILLFGVLAVVVTQLRRAGLVAKPTDGGWLTTVLWVPALLVMQDAYFYFTHRALHHPRLFPLMHRVHHRSLDPSPLASFAFHPGEALIEGVFGVSVALLLAPPVSAMIVFQLIAFFINLYGHLGVELLPARYAQGVGFVLLNTTTHHHQHHGTMNYNFGLYFQWWDRLLGTNHPRYRETFLVNAQRGAAPAHATGVTLAHVPTPSGPAS